jgi:hypothetical protein
MYPQAHQFEPLLPTLPLPEEAAPALHYLFLAGSAPRGEFKQMTGLASRSADRAIAALLKRGLLESDSAKGPVRFGLPLEALSYYFPTLYPEAAA